MRKKIFIIHGKGISRGIGKEGGGDLDTVSSNAFYMVWAQNALKEELGREPVYGQDFEFDFLNYSEGVDHLAVHAGCDIYLPDFPIDALGPRLKMLVIEEEESIDLINKFTAEINDFKLWIIKNADKVGDDLKAIFNATFKQIPKVLEHQERATLLTALKMLALTRHIVELDVMAPEGEKGSDVLAGFRKGMVTNLSGPKLKDLKKSLKNILNDSSREKMIDILVKKGNERDNIIAFDEAVKKNMSTNGRINYTDELIIVMVEMVAYILRSLRQLRDLPWDDKQKKAAELAVRGALEDLKRHLRVMVSMATTASASESEGLNEPIAGIKETAEGIINILSQIEDYVPAPPSREKEFPISIMLTEEATGKSVPGIEIVITRLEGSGSFTLPDGTSSEDQSVVVETDERGAVNLHYQPASPGEEFRLSVTFDDLQEVLLPLNAPPPDPAVSETLDEIRPEIIEEEFEEKEEEKPEGIDRALQVSLKIIERQFRGLKEKDVHFASVDDHHPYTQEIFDLLKKLEGEGVIDHIQIASLPRGDELPIDKQTCGGALIYKDRIKDKPWDNPGLAELCRIVRLQDLHIEMEPVALEISKLIGSKFSKIAIATGIAGVKDYEGMRNIMADTGWDQKVKEYEDGLEKVYPRTEQILGSIDFHKPDNEDARVKIMACVSPFCDAKKGEVQINVASAINYLMGRKGLPADYIFYCYGSQLMTTRKPNEEETSLNLSTMCQAIGTKADGGHSGAATCKPSSNPSFPTKQLDKVKDTNFLGYLEYLGGKVADYSGLQLDGVGEVPIEEYIEPVEKALRHVGENTFEIKLENKENPEDTLRVLFTRAPKVNRKAGETKPSFLQVINYLKRTQEFDYLIFSQGMMYRIIVTNTGDSEKRLNPPALARIIGWSEDDGNDVQAVADIKKNPKVKKRLRKLLSPHLVQLAHLMADFLEQGSDYRPVSVSPIFFGGAREAAAPICERMDENSYLIELVSTGGGEKKEKLRLVATLAASYDKRAGEFEPSLSLVADHFRALEPDYLFYSEADLQFPRKQQISVLMRVDDSSASIDCAEAVSALFAQPLYCGIENVVEYMPAYVEGSPLGQTKVNSRNYREYLEYVLPKMAEAVGYKVESFEPIK